MYVVRYWSKERMPPLRTPLIPFLQRYALLQLSKPSQRMLRIYVSSECARVDINLGEEELEAEEIEELCYANCDLQVEYWAHRRQLIIMFPVSPPVGAANSEIILQLGIWNREANLGKWLPL